MDNRNRLSASAILQLGDPRLRQQASPVADPAHGEVVDDARRLYKALENFRREYGFGRATAAPQLGIGRRMIAMHLKGWPAMIFNPEILWRSGTQLTLWDDCMCFPNLLVRVARVDSISLRFQDREGRVHERHQCDIATSELLQHEIDHLDGILAVDRAVGRDALVSRAVYTANRAYFLAQVDYQGT